MKKTLFLALAPLAVAGGCSWLEWQPAGGGPPEPLTADKLGAVVAAAVASELDKQPAGETTPAADIGKAVAESLVDVLGGADGKILSSATGPPVDWSELITWLVAMGLSAAGLGSVGGAKLYRYAERPARMRAEALANVASVDAKRIAEELAKLKTG